MKILSDYEKGFLEGIIDADGCVSLYKKRYYKDKGHGSAKRGWTPSIKVMIANNSIELLQKIQNIINEKGMIAEKRKKGYKKINYELRYSHDVCRWLLPQLRFIVKEERRILALKILSHIKGNTRGDDAYEKKLEQLVKEFQKFQKIS